MLPRHLPEKLLTELFQGLVVLDAEYGEYRNYMESGGYSLLVETAEDICQLQEIINTDTRQPEWATFIGTTGYVSALYIQNDDFSIMLYLPEAIAPETIKKELEE